jgi:UDPglucose 6-dehydrogenase
LAVLADFAAAKGVFAEGLVKPVREKLTAEWRGGQGARVRAELRGKKVALLGLTFKPNTDDMRDSPAIAVAQTLTDSGVSVAAYDPEGMEIAKPLMPEVAMCDDPYAAITGADAVAIVTEWDAFRALDLGRVMELANQPVLVDLRNIYRPDDMREAGFDYSSVGRG